MADLTGQSFGRYHILEPLGEGGMATVYKAYDTRLERDVAVKVIRIESFPPDQLGLLLKRFEREAKALGKLLHPNIVSVIDYGDEQGMPYLVMVHLPGGTLKGRLGKPMPWQEAARLLLPVARALQFAHMQGIIHRDIKPSNILITLSGEPMLSDFGIAKILDVQETTQLTGTGVGIGTPEYMSPEQGMGRAVDGRCDIYSLGVVLYELLTGRKPFTADTPMAVVFKHMTEPLPSPRKHVPGLPEAVEKVVIKALRKEPENRYADMGQFANALEGLLANTRPQTVEHTQPAPQTASSEQTIDFMPVNTPTLAVEPEVRLSESTRVAAPEPEEETRRGRGGTPKAVFWLAGAGAVILLAVALVAGLARLGGRAATATPGTAGTNPVVFEPAASAGLLASTPVSPTAEGTADADRAIRISFAGSGHADAASLAFTNWDAASPQEVPSSCAFCHTTGGYQEYIRSGKVAQAIPAPAGALDCGTCHNQEAEKLRAVTFPSGLTVDKLGREAVCITCHYGRQSRADVDAQIARFNASGDPDGIVAAIKDANGNMVRFSFFNPHYMAAAAVWYGSDAQGFYEYEGKKYAGAYQHPAVDDKTGCVGCHDAHSGKTKDELCKACHGDVSLESIRNEKSRADYNGNGNITEGIYQEYFPLLDMLYKEIEAYTLREIGYVIVYDPNAYPYWFADGNENGMHETEEVSYSQWTPRLYKAAYNFHFLKENPGAGVHNPRYAMQIAIDSIEDLGGDVSGFVRP